jgi:KDO2-lipid IV(A) lauroyltransferase
MYYVVYGILFLFSLLPLAILYLLSDLTYFILYYIVGYRRNVVMSNLFQVFPDKTERERRMIAKKFYRNFTDNFIEVIKLISASRSFIEKHFTGDFSIPNRIYDEGKRCQMMLAHNFNWEMSCLGIPLKSKHLLLIVYMPIGNKVIDRLFMRIRTRTGGVLVPATDMRTGMLPYRNRLYMLGLVADQNPGHPKNAYWFNFFGKPTPFVKGAESGARRGNTPVLFCKFIKPKRGYYKIIFEIGEENPAATEPTEISKKYITYVTKFVREHPELWLWSHRRWKWDWKPEYGEPIKQDSPH